MLDISEKSVIDFPTVVYAKRCHRCHFSIDGRVSDGVSQRNISFKILDKKVLK